jgi:hypothetical protein
LLAAAAVGACIGHWTTARPLPTLTLHDARTLDHDRGEDHIIHVRFLSSKSLSGTSLLVGGSQQVDTDSNIRIWKNAPQGGLPVTLLILDSSGAPLTTLRISVSDLLKLTEITIGKSSMNDPLYRLEPSVPVIELRETSSEVAR